MERVADVGEELASLAHEEEPTPEQITRSAHPARIDVGLGETAATQHHRELVRVDLVVLGLGPVDRLHIEGVTEDEGDLLARAQVGEPVPAEDALDANHEALAVGPGRLEEGSRLGAHPLWSRLLPCASRTHRYSVRACRSTPQ